MKTKLAAAISMALLSAGANAQSVVTVGGESVNLDIHQSLISEGMKNKISVSEEIKFVPEAGLDGGEYVYIVRLKDAAVANYQGDVAGLKSTAPQMRLQAKGTAGKGDGKIQASQPAVKAYVSYLKSKQNHFVMKARAATGADINALTTFHYAFNGLSVRLTQDQAMKLAELPEVAFIEREQLQYMETDVSQALIGSPKVWDGSATGVKAMGEGVIVGIIDSGINSDHASFADVGQDGYDHTNPWGTGVYVGDCKTEFADMCNDKLIGVRSYPEIVDSYDDVAVFGETPPAKNGEDYGGHGSHVASTAAGNILVNVPFVQGEVGKLESDGVATGLEFAQMSGVAPHANVIAYQICRPGNAGDKYSGCPTSATLKALDDAIVDGVDVLNYSISGGGNPWRSAAELGFLAARNAGIFVAAAAGNTRAATQTSPAITQKPYSTPKNAPWYTSVANSTHNRDIIRAVTFDGQQFSFSAGSGPVQSEVVTGVPVYAGAVDETNVEGCKAFAADSFKDKIALIKRGTCNFATKVNAAVAAGAKAVIVFNRDGEGDARLIMSGLEATTVPSVFISNLDGLAMVKALETNATLEVIINPAPQIAEKEADVLSASSLIGPNATNDVLVPFVAAPGTDIYAAYADQQFGHENTGTDPADFTLMSGTSMASPHVAGAGALLKSAHPDWTPDNIRSALMLTATTAQAMKKADGTTVADPFDVGAGRIRVDLAAQSGLVMDESALNYEVANPGLNGDPRKLNLPSMADSKCVNTCSWTRTVTATADGTWTATGIAVTEKLALTVEPASFTLKKGGSQAIVVTADVTEVGEDWGFGNLELKSDSHPTANMPIVAKIAKRNLPSSLVVNAGRNADELNIAGLKAVDLPDVSGKISALKLSDTYETTIKQDSNVDSAFDDLSDGVKVFKFAVADKALYFQTSISYTTSPDLDLFVLLDKKDGSNISMVKSSAYAGSNESVLLSNPVAGDYYVVVQNYEASSVGADDVFGLKQLTLYDEMGDNLALKLTGDNKDFALNLAWNDDMLTGDAGLAMVTLSTSDTLIAPVRIPVVFNRVGDDVMLPMDSVISGDLAAGVAKTVSTKIEANKTQETRVYQLEAKLPEGHEAANISHEGTLAGNMITWQVEMTSGTDVQEVKFDLIPRKSSVDNEVVMTHKVDNATAKTLSQTYHFDVAQVAPVAMVAAPKSIQEGQTILFDATVSSDANADPLTYKWTQLGGTTVQFDPTAAKLNVVAPAVSGNAQTISFQMEVDDGHGNGDTTVVSVSVTDTPKKDDGGALGWLSLLLVPFARARRKQR